MSRPAYALALHGGAGAQPGVDYGEVEAHMREVILDGEALLKAGHSALDAVEHVVRALEVSGLYVAGRGAGQNSAGYVELDASIMEGHTRRAGAVAAVRDLVSPVNAARLVMEQTAHVMLAGSGAAKLAETCGLERVTHPESYYTLPVGAEAADAENALAHGTVGAVALDQQGRLASATSTGGVFGKREGRVGDTPLIGAGTWATEAVAISCTGVGEYFIRAGGALDIAAHMAYGGRDLSDASDAMLTRVAEMGGDGGVIALTRSGEILCRYNSEGMKHASLRAGETPVIATFTPTHSTP